MRASGVLQMVEHQGRDVINKGPKAQKALRQERHQIGIQTGNLQGSHEKRRARPLYGRCARVGAHRYLGHFETAPGGL